VRYSGISFGYHTASLLGAAPAPIIATALLQWAGGNAWPVAAYAAFNAFISLVAVYLASDSRSKKLRFRLKQIGWLSA